MTGTHTFGEFEDSKLYSVEAIAKKWGRSEKETRRILVDNFHIAQFGNLILVSGLSLRLDVERMAQSPQARGDSGELPSEPHMRRKKPVPPADEADEPKTRPRAPRRKKPNID